MESKYVRVMPDYCSTGLWSKGGGVLCYEDIPISSGSKLAVQAWNNHYDFTDPRTNTFRNIHEKKAHNEMGKLIAQQIKAELPDWTVVFYDSIKAEDRVADRSHFEYEIG